jgi:hypothetical protein
LIWTVIAGAGPWRPGFGRRRHAGSRSFRWADNACSLRPISADTFLVRPKGITATGYTTTQSAGWVLGAVDHYAQNIFATFEVTLGPTALFQYKWATGGVGRSAVGYVVGWSY